MVRKTSRKEVAYTRLKAAIISGDLSPGEKLAENDLSRTMRVSRTPIREAFRQLQMEGLITVISNRGAFVSKLPTDEIEESYNIISVLEGYSAELAAKKINGAALERLQELQKELMISALQKNYREYMEKNTVFHRFITEMSGNRTLTKTVMELRSRVFRYRFISVTIPGFLERYADDHEKIIEAIARKDAARARKSMSAHVQFVKKVLVSYLKEYG